MASAKRRKRRRRRARAGGSSGAAQAGETKREARAAPTPRRSAAAEEPPPAPWGSFPLIELCVLAGIVMLILGAFVVSGDRGPILIAAGLALGSIGGLELSIREHLAGYRSHTLVLAGVPALIVLGLLFYLAPEGLPPLARAAIGLAVFAAAAALLMRLFSSRSGGARFRFAPLRKRR